MQVSPGRRPLSSEVARMEIVIIGLLAVVVTILVAVVCQQEERIEDLEDLVRMILHQ